MRTLDFHLLGTVELGAILELQRRLVRAAVDGQARSTPILLCEHPLAISLGRSGSRAHIRMEMEQLERRGIRVEWVSRGGGCVLHAPGQLAIYAVIAPEEFGWSIGGYGRRLQQAIATAIANLKIPAVLQSDGLGVCGNRGLLVAAGLKVEHGVAHFGAYLNVAPDMSLFGFIDTTVPRPSRGPSTMSSLMVERRGPVHMSAVRSQLIASLSEQFDCESHHIHMGHPWLTVASVPERSESR